MKIQFSHANGIPARSYDSFFGALAPHQVSFVPFFGLGDYDLARGWQPMVDELILTLETSHSEPVVGVGHSLGGVLTFRAAQVRPDLFSRVILLDPPLFGLRTRAALGVANILGLGGKLIPPAVKTLARRATFASREDAYAYWMQRPFFQRFEERSMRNYVEHGLIPHPTDGFTLTLSKMREYQIFLHTPVRLGNTRLAMPSDFVYAANGGIHAAHDLRWLRRNFSHTHFHAAKGTHLFPLEHPLGTAELIKSLL